MPSVEIRLPALHPGQLRVARELGRRNVLMCGRRLGKTTFLEDRALTHGGVLDGRPVGYFVPTYKYVPETWDRLVAAMRPVIRSVSKQDRRIVCVTGGVLDVWSLENEDAGRGRKYARVLIDEAQSVANLERCWTRAIRPTLTDLRGDAIFGGTPKAATSYFVSLFLRGQSGDDGWRSWRLPTTENPHIPRDEIDEARAEYEAAGLLHVFEQEYEAKPSEDGGNPFGLSKIRACIAELSSADPVAMGWDLAKSHDWTVGMGLDADGRVCRFHRFQLPWGETREAIEEHTIAPALVDSTGVGDPIVEDLVRMGLPVDGFRFDGTSRQQLLEGLRAEIHRGTISFPDGQTVRELESFGIRVTSRGGVSYRCADGLHDDCVMALALAVWKWKALGYGAGPNAVASAYAELLGQAAGSDDAALRAEMAERAEVSRIVSRVRERKRSAPRQQQDDDSESPWV